MSRIISYRGLLANGGQDTINLHTNDGKTGYKIIKFQCMGPDSSEDIESAIKIYKVKQSTIDDAINFSDGILLACSIISQSATSQTHAVDRAVIFDNEIFNQDIYVTTSGGDYSASINYYIELEQVPLTEDQALVAIVKNLRNEQ
jgi:nitrogen regulatory protein PII-like uncharacterized protein